MWEWSYLYCLTLESRVTYKKYGQHNTSVQLLLLDIVFLVCWKRKIYLVSWKRRRKGQQNYPDLKLIVILIYFIFFSNYIVNTKKPSEITAFFSNINYWNHPKQIQERHATRRQGHGGDTHSASQLISTVLRRLRRNNRNRTRVLNHYCLSISIVSSL